MASFTVSDQADAIVLRKIMEALSIEAASSRDR